MVENIFLVLVVVDSSNKYSRDALNPEVLKTLHFFPDKESVLVINKASIIHFPLVGRFYDIYLYFMHRIFICATSQR